MATCAACSQETELDQCPRCGASLRGAQELVDALSVSSGKRLATWKVLAVVVGVPVALFVAFFLLSGGPEAADAGALQPLPPQPPGRAAPVEGAPNYDTPYGNVHPPSVPGQKR